MKSWKTVWVPVLALNLLVALTAAGARADEISSYAFVRDDGTLRVSGYTIRLFGIYIPPTAQSCRSFERPVTCAPQAILALDFKIGADFVHCDPQTHNDDGSITAVCRVGDTDLSAYLLSRGWALALPDAPFDYAALEKIARHRGLGIWGLPVERRH